MTIILMVTVKYSCVLCGLQNQSVQIPARPETTDVREWMKMMETLLASDHVQRSPGCQPKTLQNIMIPFPAGGWVGGPPIA